jgi:hypothetical protein
MILTDQTSACKNVKTKLDLQYYSETTQCFPFQRSRSGPESGEGQVLGVKLKVAESGGGGGPWRGTEKRGASL